VNEILEEEVKSCFSYILIFVYQGSEILHADLTHKKKLDERSVACLQTREQGPPSLPLEFKNIHKDRSLLI
jgi:hypothetical protein